MTIQTSYDLHEWILFRTLNYGQCVGCIIEIVMCDDPHYVVRVGNEYFDVELSQIDHAIDIDFDPKAKKGDDVCQEY